MADWQTGMTAFARDVEKGLTVYPKKIASKYLYDKQGSKLFREIMELEDYYLTRCENEILENYSPQIVSSVSEGRSVHVYELGAGDGVKTLHLLNAFKRVGHEVTYHPLDISQKALDLLHENISSTGLDIRYIPHLGLYEDAIDNWNFDNRHVNIILFLGSNIGNMTREESTAFLRLFSEKMNPDDFLIVGMDSKKDPETLLAAYDDRQGVTAAFNYNLLSRINRELKGQFDLDQFSHVPVYNPESGEMKSYLMSLQKQEVLIADLGRSFSFEKWETLHTEISRKYDLREIDTICRGANLRLLQLFKDSQELFYECILGPI